MPQKLLATSSELVPEQTEVSLRTLRDSNILLVNTPNTIIDCSLFDYVRLNLMSNTQIELTGAVKEGHQIILAVYQADTVPHILTYGSSIRLGYDIFTFPLLSETVNKLDRLIFIYDSVANKYDFSGYSRGY